MKTITLAIILLFEFTCQGQKLSLFEKDGKIGFKNEKNKEIIEPKYSKSLKQIGVVDSSLCGDYAYSEFRFREGFTSVKLKKKWGSINKTDKEIVPFEYDYVDFFYEGLAIVNKKGEWKVGSLVNDLGELYNNEEVFVGGGRFGYVDKTGKEKIELIYDDARPFKGGLGAVKLNNKWGLINKTGKIIIPIKYDEVESFGDGYSLVKLNNKWGIFSNTGKEIVPPKYDESDNSSYRYHSQLYFYNDTTTLFDKKGVTLMKVNISANEDKYFIIDKAGTQIEQPKSKYDYEGELSDGLGRVCIGCQSWDIAYFSDGQVIIPDGKWGFIDLNKKEIVPLKYNFAESFSGGFAKVILNKKWGFIDITGKEIVSPKYDDVKNFNSEGFAAVQYNKKWGFIDKTGKVVIPLKYELAGQVVKEGKFHVKIVNDMDIYVDKTGNEYYEVSDNDAKTPVYVPIKNNNYRKMGFFKDGLAAVNVGGKSANSKNSFFSDEVSGGKWGFIDKTGKEVISPKYDRVIAFTNGLALVNMGDSVVVRENGMTIYEKGKWGFVDKTGKEIVPLIYDKVFQFSEDLALVVLKGKYGFINKTGKEIISPRYEDARSFAKGLAGVKLNNKWGFIDKTEKEIIVCKYDNVGGFEEGLAAVKLNDKWGFIDKSGKEVIPVKYDEAEAFYTGKARVTLKNKEIYIDKTGKEVK